MIFSREYYERFSESRFYPVVLGVSAFFLMLSGLVPFEVVLIPAVAASPSKWKRISAAATLGSATGAVVLAFAFRSLGRAGLDHLFPTLGASHGWSVAQDWMAQYGVWPIVVFAALPIAQAPILAVAGLLQVSEIAILAAFLCGKSLKYSIIAYTVVRGEHRFLKRKTTSTSSVKVPLSIR